MSARSYFYNLTDQEVRSFLYFGSGTPDSVRVSTDHLPEGGWRTSSPWRVRCGPWSFREGPVRTGLVSGVTVGDGRTTPSVVVIPGLRVLTGDVTSESVAGTRGFFGVCVVRFFDVVCVSGPDRVSQVTVCRVTTTKFGPLTPDLCGKG